MSVAWQEAANCRGVSPKLFFPEPGQNQKPMMAICKPCPVRAQCLQHALDNYEVGIWGGTSDRERERIRRQQGPVSVPRGRPALAPNTVTWRHGTPYGYHQHLRYGVPTCAACRFASNDYASERKRLRRVAS